MENIVSVAVSMIICVNTMSYHFLKLLLLFCKVSLFVKYTRTNHADNDHVHHCCKQISASLSVKTQVHSLQWLTLPFTRSALPKTRKKSQGTFHLMRATHAMQTWPRPPERPCMRTRRAWDSCRNPGSITNISSSLTQRTMVSSRSRCSARLQWPPGRRKGREEGKGDGEREKKQFCLRFLTSLCLLVAGLGYVTLLDERHTHNNARDFFVIIFFLSFTEGRQRNAKVPDLFFSLSLFLGLLFFIFDFRARPSLTLLFSPFVSFLGGAEED